MASDFTYTSSRGNTYTRKNDVDYKTFQTEEQKKAEEKIAQFAAGANASKDQYIADISTGYDASIKAAQDSAAQQRLETEEEYAAGFDMNAASELAAQRRLREQLANDGLLQSGYNATNQTALQIQRANADAETRRQKQAAVDKIRLALQQYEAEAADDIAQKKAAASYETAQKIGAQTTSELANADSRAINRYNLALSEQDALNDFIWNIEQQEAANEAAAIQAAAEVRAAEIKAATSGSKSSNGSGSGGSEDASEVTQIPAAYEGVIGRARKHMEGGKPLQAMDELYKMVQYGGTKLTKAQLRDICVDLDINYNYLAYCIATGVRPTNADIRLIK